MIQIHERVNDYAAMRNETEAGAEESLSIFSEIHEFCSRNILLLPKFCIREFSNRIMPILVPLKNIYEILIFRCIKDDGTALPNIEEIIADANRENDLKSEKFYYNNLCA